MSEQIAAHKLQVVLAQGQGLQAILVCNDGHDSEECWLQEAFEDLGSDGFMRLYGGKEVWLTSIPIQAPIYNDEISFTIGTA